VKDVDRERLYLTLDFWETREAYEKFKEMHAEEYDRMDGNARDDAAGESDREFGTR